jgi:hypothetical protein
MKRILLIALLLVSTTALADPPKRWMSMWDFMRAYHAVVQEEQGVVQEAPKPQEQQKQKPRKKPPCSRACQANFGEAVNYPPYDLEP